MPSDDEDLDDDTDTTEATPVDLDGNPRFVNDPNTDDCVNCPQLLDCGTAPIVDMGAYEFQLIDCDQNEIPDQCDPECGIPGGPCDFPDGGNGLDCNANEIPDNCDIDPDDPDENGEVSGDCQPDNIPDECQSTGAVVSEWGGGAGLWDVDQKWCPAVIPDNADGDTFDVTIAEVTSVVTLNMSPTITALSIEAGATLEVNADSGASTRFLGSDNPVSNDGLIRATDGFRFLLDSADVNQTVDGVIEADGAESEVGINGRSVTGGTIRSINGGVVELLSGGTLEGVTLDGVVVPDGNNAFIAGNIDNAGLFTVEGVGASPAALEPTLANAVVPGANGVLTLRDENGSSLGSVFTNRGLTNATEHTIDGAGIILGVFTNEGNVIANQTSATLTIAFGTKQNNGLFAAKDGGILSIDAPLILSPTGTIEATDRGLVAINAAITDAAGSGGRVLTCDGSIMMDFDVQVDVASVSVAGDGSAASQISVCNGATLNLAGPLSVEDLSLPSPPTASARGGCAPPPPAGACSALAHAALGGCAPPPPQSNAYLTAMDSANVNIDGALTLAGAGRRQHRGHRGGHAGGQLRQSKYESRVVRLVACAVDLGRHHPIL